MAKTNQMDIKISLRMNTTGMDQVTYSEDFEIPLNDELDTGEVLAAFVSYLGMFRRELTGVPAAVRMAADVLGEG